MDIRLACLDFMKATSKENMNLRQMQRYLAVLAIEAELVKQNGNQSAAARQLGINRLTLRTYLKNQ